MSFQALRHDLDSNEEIINTLCQVSPILVGKASQQDKLDVHKQLSEVTDQWDALENCWSKRKTELEQLHDLSEQYHSELEAVEKWMAEEEQKVGDQTPVGTDVKEVKKQLQNARVG